MKKAKFWIKKQNKLQCNLCNHYCLIAVNKTGLCGVRKNINDQLYSLVYGRVIAENIDPIEKKPLFHFLPGSLAYSLATVGCNFRCLHCQNADISQFTEKGLNHDSVPGKNRTSQELVTQALESNCASIAYTYTEPTIFAEFAIDCMKLAKEAGLKNVWVSNGYTAKEAWPKIFPHLDAINVDLKFYNPQTYLKICGAKLQPVLDNLIILKKQNIWLEVTTLIIPGLNDSQDELYQLAGFIKNKLGAKTPWHVSRFYPQYKMSDINPAEDDLIYKAYEIGKTIGLSYVYGGNLPNTELENTYCPDCGTLLIERRAYQIQLHAEKICPGCGRKVDIR